MKIIGIVGVLDLRGSEERVWKHMLSAFRKEFPDTQFVIQHALYFPWQTTKIRVLADSVLAEHDTGDDLILFGWSLGGVIACAIAPRFKKSKIIGIITIGAPHRIPHFYRMLASSIRESLPSRIMTYAGIFDPVVPWFITSRPDGEHTNLWSDHWLAFIVSSHFADTVANKARKLL